MDARAAGPQVAFLSWNSDPISLSQLTCQCKSSRGLKASHTAQRPSTWCLPQLPRSYHR